MPSAKHSYQILKVYVQRLIEELASNATYYAVWRQAPVLLQSDVSQSSPVDGKQELTYAPTSSDISNQPQAVEGVGTVIRAGTRVTRLRPGDRVFFITHQAGVANLVRVDAHYVRCVPNGLSTTQAASMPVAFSTAIVCLQRIAQLRQGESVLIHAASGAVGQACIMLAKHIGATIFATAGTAAKRDFLCEHFQIPQSHIFSSRTSDFHPAVMYMTDGKGVDVVINSLSGELLQAGWQCVAEYGRFVELGKKDALQNRHLSMRPFDRNISFTSVDLRQTFARKPEMVQELLSTIVELHATGAIGPIYPVSEFPVSKLETALRKLQSGDNTGKIVITTGSEEFVPVEMASPLCPDEHRILRKDATYLVTGGTGGIGGHLADWIVKNGGTNIVLLGRRGPASPRMKVLLERFDGTDVNLQVVACDVSSKESLTDALETVARCKMPTVRGVIHGALHYRASLFKNASFEEWQDVTAPKVKATWHLHELLPNLDFFVCLSSVGGLIGYEGQSIYNGTSTFLDAFTAYRRRCKLPATCITLPVVEGAGFAIERGLVDSLKTSVGSSLLISQVCTCVKAVILDSPALCDEGIVTAALSCRHAADTSQSGWRRTKMLEDFCQDDIRDVSTTVSRSEESEDRSTPGDGSPLSHENVGSRLADKISSITMIDKKDINPEGDLSTFGLDSLSSVELRNWTHRQFGAELSLGQILGARDLSKMAQSIVERLE